jgi:hypothetical protein
MAAQARNHENHENLRELQHAFDSGALACAAESCEWG